MQAVESANLITRPIVPKGTHPVETGRYLLATTEIIRLHETVMEWIDRRAPGGIIYGRPRLGKTRAINFLTHVIPAELEATIPIFVTNCRQYKQPNESYFFEDILKDVGHLLAPVGKANRKRDRLANFLLEKGYSSGQHRIIIFIDDAQRLHEIQYGWLMDIYNELDRAGICLTVILVGQQELIHQRSAFKQAKKMQLIGRFMTHEYKFTGLQGIKDFQACLRGYDVESEYPEQSGWSFCRYFFPEAYEQGLRLERYSEELFSVFNEMRSEAGLGKQVDIPMQYIVLTVEYVLRRFGANGADVNWLTRAHWKEAVSKSGYIEAEVLQDY